MEKTPKQLWKDTVNWVKANPVPFKALGMAAGIISDAGEQVPMQFICEVARYNNVLGPKTMHRLIDVLSGVSFAKGEYAIPNAVVAGVARLLKKEDPTLNIRTAHSKLDDAGVV